MVKPKSRDSLILLTGLIALFVGFYMWRKQRQAQSGKSAAQSPVSPGSLDALARALFGGGSKTQRVQSGGGSSSSSVQAKIDLGAVVQLIGDGVKALGKGVAYVAKGIGADVASLFGYSATEGGYLKVATTVDSSKPGFFTPLAEASWPAHGDSV